MEELSFYQPDPHWASSLIHKPVQLRPYIQESISCNVVICVDNKKQHPHQEFTSGSEFKIAHLATQPGWLEGSNQKDAPYLTNPADPE